jgi:hypothetical protein
MLKRLEAEPTQGYDWGYVVYNHTPDKINGSIFEVIESLGLQEKQEEAVKKIMRSKVWDIFSNHAVQIGDRLHTQIRNKHYNVEKMEDLSTVSSHMVEEL